MAYRGRMATLASVIRRARLELGDEFEPFMTTTVADGVSTAVDLPGHPVSATNLQVLIDGVAVTTGWTLDERNGVLTFDVPPDVDTAIMVIGQRVWYFGDSDWEIFAREAATFHLHGRETTLAGLPEVEEPLVAWLAVIEAVWSLIGNSAGDIDIRTPEGVSIPRTQRTMYLTEYAERLRARYRDYSAQLNVGLHRMEVVTARRVARSTGRLVPVYRAQELEDPSPRERIYPAIPKGLIR